jgi:hypothetical protein
VAVALPELRPYSQVVRIAETTDEFVNLIREAQRDHTAEAIQSRVAVARENTWDYRVMEMYHVLERYQFTRAQEITPTHARVADPLIRSGDQLSSKLAPEIQHPQYKGAERVGDLEI